MISPKVPLAEEGYPFIGIAAFATLVFGLLEYQVASLVSFILTLFITNFFRDPERFTPEDETACVSPADGKIIVVEKIFDSRFTSQEVVKLSIFMNVFNVHVNRIPFPGKVDRIIYSPGKFYSADSEKGGLENEYCATIMTTATGQKMAVVQVAGLIARRIVCWLEKGDMTTKGRRYGLIRFGSRVDLFLPQDTEIKVQKGDTVKAGETILGNIK